MDFGEFIRNYFINPVNDRSGYNIINTVIYALIALFFAFIFLKILKKEKVRIDIKFVLCVIPFIVLGSTVRVVTDATGDVAAGLPNHFLANSSYLLGLYGVVGSLHLYDYGFLTATPGIYIIIGSLTFLSILLFNRMKKMELLPKLVALLILLHLVLLLPLMKNWSYLLLIIVLAAVGVLVGKFILQKMKMKLKPAIAQQIVILSHSLDGAASYVAIELFNGGRMYFEQHVLSNALGVFFGSMFAFYVIKVLFSTLAVYLVESSNDTREDKNYVFLLLIIFGLAPGVRDLLRLLAGV
ncbi:MAG: DUF63 family protein [Candidatus Micrarchaeota archaeon]|nr:DUF63 family protein [Candidatus Micrarchaeota archaeon]